MRLASFMALLLGMAVLSGCVSQSDGSTTSEPERAASACMSACKVAAAAGTALEKGPCLTDAAMPQGWVCDIAHSPRTAADNDPANQCEAFGKAASHFVEVYPDCTLLRAL